MHYDTEQCANCAAVLGGLRIGLEIFVEEAAHAEGEAAVPVTLPKRVLQKYFLLYRSLNITC